MIHQLFLNSFYNPEQLNSAQTQCICRVQAMSKERHQCRESLLHPHILLQQFHKEFHSFLFTQTNYKCKRLHKQLLDFLTNTRQSVQKRFLSLCSQQSTMKCAATEGGGILTEYLCCVLDSDTCFQSVRFLRPKGRSHMAALDRNTLGFKDYT